jgi:hypothetical protein
MSLDWSVSEDAPDDDHPRCPRCNDVLLAITTCGPTEHHASPCGCRVSDVQVRALRNGRGAGIDETPTDTESTND